MLDRLALWIFDRFFRGYVESIVAEKTAAQQEKPAVPRRYVGQK